MSINLYWPISATKQAHVYDDPQKPSVINLNRHMLDRPVHSISNTLVHQCIHALNAINPEYSFGHGDNSNEGKEKTAPYWIAALAQKLVGNNTHDIDTVVHEDESAIKELQKNNSAYLLHELCEGGILCVYDHISILENK